MSNEFQPAEIQFDLDGVVVNTTPIILDRMNTLAMQHGRTISYTPRHITSFNWIQDECVKFYGMTPDEAFQFQLMWGHPDVVRQGTPYKGARSALRLLDILYEGRINYVTSRPPNTRGETVDWFEEHLPFVDPRRIHIRSESDTRSGKDIKVAGLQQSGAVRHYDDEPGTIRHVGRRNVVIMNRPYNAVSVAPDLKPYQRVYSWGAVVRKELESVARRLK